ATSRSEHSPPASLLKSSMSTLMQPTWAILSTTKSLTRTWTRSFTTRKRKKHIDYNFSASVASACSPFPSDLGWPVSPLVPPPLHIAPLAGRQLVSHGD